MVFGGLVMREPLYRMMFRMRSLPAAEQCIYLIACIKCEPEDSSRRRELQKLLIETRTRQIRHEIGRRK